MSLDRDTTLRARQAKPEDVDAIARIEVETWRATYPGMLPDRVLVGRSERRQRGAWAGLVRYRPGDVVVVEEGDVGIVGFGNCGAQRDPTLPFAGEVYTLYVTPDAQNRGVGRQLSRALFERLLDNGKRSALIWVIRANPSRFFYEHIGGKAVLTRHIRVGGAMVEAVAYGWPDLAAYLAG
jgi:ribosomal protein S18 acetylase RimI-like enzyme